MTVPAQHRRLFALDIGLPVGLLLALGAVFAMDFATGGASKPAMEIVFILDEGAGLTEFASQTKRNWLRIAESLSAQGFDCRFAVIPCPPESGQIPKIPLTADLSDLERRLTDAASDSDQPNGAWLDTDSVKALEDVLKFDFRDGASLVVFLTTSSMVEDESRLSQLAQQYRDRGIKTIIQADESDQHVFRSLYENGGQFFTLAGENKTEKPEAETDKPSDDIGSLVASISRGTTVEFPQTEQFIAGVKVRGRIALVCDISGSMTQDFPPLVNELRSKFPKDTPLILVEGCCFRGPDASNQRPIKLSEARGRQRILGVDLSNDRHVYYSTSTTDSIILAIKHFRRDTVMFNNDLQDGGSLKAIEAFEELWKKRAFTLSGRSLNRDAPQVLQEFIRKSGGDFKVDPIKRSVSPATTWRP